MKREYLRNSPIGRSIEVLPIKDRRKLMAVLVIQIFMNIMDLFGIAVIGAIGALAVVGVQSAGPGERVGKVLEILQIENLGFQNQIAFLGITAAILFVGRTILSIVFTKRIILFLSLRGAHITRELISRLLSQPLLKIQEKTSQETVFALTGGVNSIVLGIVSPTISLLSDASLLIILAAGLFVVDALTATFCILVFSLIAYRLYVYMSVKAKTFGIENTKFSISSTEIILEVLKSYREIAVRNRFYSYANRIGDERIQVAETQAGLSFMPFVSKYVIETSVVVGALALSGFQFLTQDVGHAIGTLSVFLAAGTRIAPAVLRVQQSAIQIKGSFGSAFPTLELIEELRDVPILESAEGNLDLIHDDFIPRIEIASLMFSYPNSDVNVLKGIDLLVEPGTVVALVGSSGAGKSTLVDAILGIVIPKSGNLQISGRPPREALVKWPGAIAYVPQEISLSNGSILDNILLGYAESDAPPEQITRVLEASALLEFIRDLPEGLNTKIGENGAKLSGGQRQRLGIARALYTNPKLIVLDEATSSLDGETEAYITDSMLKLKGRTTIVVIAHRLASVRNADIVVYLEEGRILGYGKFEEVRKSIPNFHHQALLMGL